MGNKIKKVYVVHHSHTDIGYTDLQERVIHCQANYIRAVLKLMKEAKNEKFRWNCETYFCVEEFFKIATEQEKQEFFALVREGKIGISAAYLNFTDLLDSDIYAARLKEMVELFASHEAVVKEAMIADINGISMGQRDAMIAQGVEFLYTNIHCHHGMYPLYQNQTPYFWENAEGKRLLVWNGEHYNLGNVLGIKPNVCNTYMGSDYFGEQKDFSDAVGSLYHNLMEYLELCEKHAYPYDFMITSVSGVFSDNAPPNTEILEIIESFNRTYGGEVQLQMVSLRELYSAIKDSLQDAPVYTGDLTDWWANGVGSTPYAVKHYKEAVRRYHLCERLEPQAAQKYPQLMRTAQDNLLLYAEHTWGHSATITDPYETMVLNLDMRKTSYASKAHESTSMMLAKIAESAGDILRYYNTEGKIRVVNTTAFEGKLPVEFYIESNRMKNAAVIRAEDETPITCQASRHPRGICISFVDTFKAGEIREYCYKEVIPAKSVINSRVAYIGAERIRDIVNTYDAFTYRLPYEFENQWFYLSYEQGKGITEFQNKATQTSMLRADSVPFFTPIYESTAIRYEQEGCGQAVYEERRKLGRNIRGTHAVTSQGILQSVSCLERGEVFTELKLDYLLPGCSHAEVVIRLYEELPRIDYKLRIAKMNSTSIESVYMPMSLTLGSEEAVYLKKGREAFRPGIDQIPGTCMEYSMSDDGVAIVGDNQSILIASRDVPLVAMGELKHHPILLCDGKTENNRRPMYSWVMNNTWETNFKMDLGGYCEFCYSLTVSGETDVERAFTQMREQNYGTHTWMIE